MRRVEALRQSAAGGLVQVTVAHGSALQAPLVQPKGQGASVEPYEQEPPEQVPVAANVRRVVLLAQTAAGGVVHDTF